MTDTASTRVSSGFVRSPQVGERWSGQAIVPDLIDLRRGSSAAFVEVAAPVVESLPEFPRMEPLSVAHLEPIRRYSRSFEDYSDFSATSLWSWSATIPDGYRVASLNGNLVVEFGDYLTQERFLSFLGVNAPDDTAEALHEHAVASGLDTTLRLIPAVTAIQLDERRWDVQADESSSDYVYSVERAGRMQGKEYRSTRHAVNAWQRRWAPCSHVEWLTTQELTARRTDILDLFDRWRGRGSAGSMRSGQERMAVDALLERASEVAPRLSDWSGVCITEGKLSAVFLNEREREDRLAGHFFKMTDEPCGDHLFTWYFTELCRRAGAAGIQYVNIQQDLGIPSLRAAKQRLRPHYLLTKCDVSLRA